MGAPPRPLGRGTPEPDSPEEQKAAGAVLLACHPRTGAVTLARDLKQLESQGCWTATARARRWKNGEDLQIADDGGIVQQAPDVPSLGLWARGLPAHLLLPFLFDPNNLPGSI